MGKLLWTPTRERVEASNLYRFIQTVNQRFGLKLDGYAALYQWSIDHIPDFWAAMWDFAHIEASRPYTGIVDDVTRMPGAKWFSGARLNFAENLLRHRDRQTALVFRGEDKTSRRLTYAQLYDEVARLAAGMRAIGVAAGDRVGGFMPNMPQTVIAMLATASIGAIWSSCSPDFGIKGVLDRFGQIKPKIIFAADGYWFKGKRVDSMARIGRIA